MTETVIYICGMRKPRRFLESNSSGECVGQYHYPVSDREPSFMRCDTGELLYVLEQDGKKFVLLSAENGQSKEFPIPDKTYTEMVWVMGKYRFMRRMRN